MHDMDFVLGILCQYPFVESRYLELYGSFGLSLRVSTYLYFSFSPTSFNYSSLLFPSSEMFGGKGSLALTEGGFVRFRNRRTFGSEYSGKVR